MLEGGLIGDANMDFNLIDAALARWHQFEVVAVGILHRERHRSARIGNRKHPEAARDSVRQRIARVIYLQHRAEQSVAILPDATADRQQLLVGQPDLFGVKRAHLVDPVGENSHIDESLRQFHFLLPQFSTASTNRRSAHTRTRCSVALSPRNAARRSSTLLAARWISRTARLPLDAP